MTLTDLRISILIPFLSGHVMTLKMLQIVMQNRTKYGKVRQILSLDLFPLGNFVYPTVLKYMLFRITALYKLIILSKASINQTI